MSKIQKREMIKALIIAEQVIEITKLTFKIMRLGVPGSFLLPALASQEDKLKAIKSTPAKLFHPEKKKLDKRRQKRFRQKCGQVVLAKKGKFQGVQVVDINWKIKDIEILRKRKKRE